MNLIASLKHTKKEDEHITFWRPASRGYTAVIERAGRYTDAEASTRNDGCNDIAVPESAVLAITSPTPFFKPGARFYDFEGPVVDNTRANWKKLMASSLADGRAYIPKPEVFKGRRRSFSLEGGAA